MRRHPTAKEARLLIPFDPGQPLTCRQLRELDALAIEHLGIPSIILMETAARCVSAFIHCSLLNPRRESVCILCGPGNNGGDGLAIARHLRCAGVPVQVVLAQSGERLRGDAAANLGMYKRICGTPLDASIEAGARATRDAINSAGIIVDALLGTGSTGPPRGAMAELIKAANARLGVRRVAVDLPSGLDADSGLVHDPCFRADATVTVVAHKTGFATPGAGAVLGRVVVADIGIPRDLIPGRHGNDG